MHATNAVGLDRISASPTNPRKRFNQAALDELTASVRSHGVLQPILLRPNGAAGHYEIVAGERRWRAAKAAGLGEIPATVRELSDAEVLEIQVIENLQRADLHPLEEAEGYESLMKCKHGDGHAYTADEIAAKVGKSRSYVYARLKYTALCKEARESFFEGKLNESTALYIARIPVPELQKKAAKEIAEPRWRNGEPMNAREAAEHVRHNYMLQLKQAPFPTGDEKLLKGATSCSACPKRTGNQPELFGDVQSADVCTDPDCFARKRGAQAARLIETAKAKGQAVIAGKEAKKLMPHSHSNLRGYVDLDQEHWDGNRSKKIRALLGKDLPPVTLIQNPHTGTMIEAVKEADAAPLLRKALPKTSRSAGTTKSAREIESEKRRRAKERLEAEIRRETYMTVREKAAASGLGLEDLRLVCAYTWARSWNDFQKVIVAWWFPVEEATADKKKPVRDRIAELSKRIPTMDGADCIRLLLDCTLVSSVQGNHNGYLAPIEMKELATMAQRHGVGQAEIRKRLATAAAEKVKPAKSAKSTKAKKPKALAEAEVEPAQEAAS